MNVDDLILISVDDHVIEPPTMFDAHIPERYGAAQGGGRQRGLSGWRR